LREKREKESGRKENEGGEREKQKGINTVDRLSEAQPSFLRRARKFSVPYILPPE
jgi:hypothetical protein